MAAVTLLCAPLLLAGCASNGYAGISLAPGAADSELQALARQAEAGDKQAQLDLGIRFEEGRGVPQSIARAEWLYLQAAADSGGTRPVYVPASGRGARASSVPTNMGPAARGLPEARERLSALGARRRGASGERRATAAAEAAPQVIHDEVYLTRRLMADRGAGNSNADAVAIRRIDGPVSVTGNFVSLDEEPDATEMCAAIQSLTRRYQDLGFGSCSAYAYARQGAGGAQVYLLTYGDNYQETEEFRSFMGHVFYRPPFSADLQLMGQPALCGTFLAFDLTVPSGHRYRLLISTDPDSNRRPQTSTACA